MKTLNNKILPRGIRNNNPCNLIKTNNNWIGKIEHGKSNDKVFEQFTTMVTGIRAGVIDIVGDIKKGKNTIEKLINEFAPPSENNTKKYIQTVSNKLKINKNDEIEVNEKTIFEIIKAIIRIENGRLGTIVTDEQIRIGIETANINKRK